MSQAIGGIFIDCDPPLRQYLLHLNAEAKVPFVVDKLASSDRQLFINASQREFVDRKISELYDKYGKDPRDAAEGQKK